MTTNDLSKEIYQLFGPVTRARNCFLYTKRGIRLTDMFQENGRAILGWQGDSAFTMFKNVLNRSQVGSFITEDKARIDKAISSLLKSERKVFWFSNKNSALKAGLFIAPSRTNFYTPWSEYTEYNTADCVIVVPPMPWTDTVYLLAVRKELISENTNELPGTVKYPFAFEAGITRAVYNLINEIPQREEKNWFLYDTILTKYWTRKGPYLYPKMSEDKYNDFVMHCLKCEIVINPNYNNPSIIPFSADKGVFTKLKNNPFEY